MARRQNKHGWFSRITFGGASLVLSGLLLLSYASLLVNPAKAWFFTIFGLLFFPLLLCTALFFIWALLRRSRTAFLLALMLLPSLLLFGRYYQFKGPDEAEEPTLKVVSYNVGRFAYRTEKDARLARADSVAAYLRGLDADIICLQEFYLPPKEEEIGSWLRRHFPGYQAEYYALTEKSGRFGNITISRLPIVAKGKLTFEKSTNMAFYTDIRLKNTTLRFYNCHFESYNISIPALFKRIGNREEDVMEDTGRRMRRSITQRPQQVETVMRDIDACPVRSVVLGDFNDTPVSYTYQRLRRGHSDTFVKAGKGFGATYSLLQPLLRIDYILYPKDLKAVSYKVDRVSFSDHYPVIATYSE